MEVVEPMIDPKTVPPGSRPVLIAGQQAEYQPLPTVRTPDGQVITRWKPSPEERRRIAEGEDIYVTLLSHGPINPLIVTVGPVDWTA